MTQEKRERLEKAGWVEGTAAQFLGLSPREEAQVEVGVAANRYNREMTDEHFVLLRDAVTSYEAHRTDDERARENAAKQDAAT